MTEVKVVRINRYEKRCVSKNTGEECKNEGSKSCYKCSVFFGIPSNGQVKELMFR